MILIVSVCSQVNISKGASIQVKGIPGLCGSSISSCKAYGGSGGIVQIISDSGHIASDAIILGAGPRGHPPDPQPGFLYIKGKIKYRTQNLNLATCYQFEFVDNHFPWDQTRDTITLVFVNILLVGLDLKALNVNLKLSFISLVEGRLYCCLTRKLPNSPTYLLFGRSRENLLTFIFL